MTLLVLLLVSSILSSTMATTPDARMYPPSFLVDIFDIKDSFIAGIPDIKELRLELNQLTIQPKLGFTPTGNPKAKDGYNDSSPQPTGTRVLRIWQETPLLKPKPSFVIIL